MKFSVIIPTFNRPPLLAKCLTAIFALEFPSEDFEVMVVNDGSSGQTPDYLASINQPNFRWFSQEHRGPAAARNLAAQKSQADFLAFTDDDCLVPPDWLQRLSEGFSKHPQAAAVGGYLEAPPQVLAKNWRAQLEAFETHQIYGAGLGEYVGGFESPAGGTNNIAYRRHVFEKLGGFDETFPVPAGEDADLKLRTVEAGCPIVYLPLKVTHLDPYSFKSFLRRSVIAGVGSAHFEKKHYGQKDSFLGLSFQFGRRALKLATAAVFSLGRNRISILRSLKALLMIFGRYRYLTTNKHHGSLALDSNRFE